MWSQWAKLPSSRGDKEGGKLPHSRGSTLPSFQASEEARYQSPEEKQAPNEGSVKPVGKGQPEYHLQKEASVKPVGELNTKLQSNKFEDDWEYVNSPVHGPDTYADQPTQTPHLWISGEV